jgi:hypothetical protein
MNQIDVLPDDALLEIFDFYTDTSPFHELILSDECKAVIGAWQLLVHVCRRWRGVVLGSPRRLNLRLYCTSKTRIRDTLDVWPAFPLVVNSVRSSESDRATENIITALGQNSRVCQVYLNLADLELGRVLAAMEVPFPELTELWLLPPFRTELLTIPDSFLGGSVPRLRILKLSDIPFPGLPKLLLSTTHLLSLTLCDIPHSGYFSPEAIVAPLSAMSSLKTLYLGYKSPYSHPASGWRSRSLPLQKRSILPSLDKFHFTGVSEYLEDLVTRIDTPQLDEILIVFFNRLNIDCPLLKQFINRPPALLVRNEAHVQFGDYVASVALQAQSGTIKIGISCIQPDRQLWFVAQVCNSPGLLHPLTSVEDLYIDHKHQFWRLYEAIESALWLQLLLPFTAVKNLYLSEKIAPGIAAALQEFVGGRITEVLPSLQNIFVDRLDPSGPFQENIGQFVAARQLSDRPVAISFWNKDHYMAPQLKSIM